MQIKLWYNSEFTIYCLECTDSWYVAHSVDLLYRKGYDAFRRAGPGMEFFNTLHSAGKLNEKMVSVNHEKKRIYGIYPKTSSPMNINNPNKLTRTITTTAKKARIDRSLAFMILTSPITRAAMPEIRQVKPSIIAPRLPRSMPSSRTKTNIRSTMQTAAKPTDHLPKEVFGRILIRTFITSFGT